MILTTFDQDDYIRQAIANGASGYLLKSNPPQQIKQAILTIAGGNAVVQEAVLERLQSQAQADRASKLKELTPREQDILVAIADGMTNREIADKLYLSEGTIKNTITSILTKLNLRHRTEIAVYYWKD